jgi:hypothetical protein
MQQRPATFLFDYQNRPDAKRELKQFDVAEGTEWPEVLNEFVSFLGRVYGYDLSPNVVVVTAE